MLPGSSRGGVPLPPTGRDSAREFAPTTNSFAAMPQPALRHLFRHSILLSLLPVVLCCGLLNGLTVFNGPMTTQLAVQAFKVANYSCSNANATSAADCAAISKPRGYQCHWLEASSPHEGSANSTTSNGTGATGRGWCTADYIQFKLVPNPESSILAERNQGIYHSAPLAFGALSAFITGRRMHHGCLPSFFRFGCVTGILATACLILSDYVEIFGLEVFFVMMLGIPLGMFVVLVPAYVFRSLQGTELAAWAIKIMGSESIVTTGGVDPMTSRNYGAVGTGSANYHPQSATVANNNNNNNNNNSVAASNRAVFTRSTPAAALGAPMDRAAFRTYAMAWFDRVGYEACLRLFRVTVSIGYLLSMLLCLAIATGLQSRHLELPTAKIVLHVSLLPLFFAVWIITKVQSTHVYFADDDGRTRLIPSTEPEADAAEAAISPAGHRKSAIARFGAAPLIRFSMPVIMEENVLLADAATTSWALCGGIGMAFAQMYCLAEINGTLGYFGASGEDGVSASSLSSGVLFNSSGAPSSPIVVQWPTMGVHMVAVVSAIVAVPLSLWAIVWARIPSRRLFEWGACLSVLLAVGKLFTKFLGANHDGEITLGFLFATSCVFELTMSNNFLALSFRLFTSSAADEPVLAAIDTTGGDGALRANPHARPLVDNDENTNVKGPAVAGRSFQWPLLPPPAIAPPEQGSTTQQSGATNAAAVRRVFDGLPPSDSLVSSVVMKTEDVLKQELFTGRSVAAEESGAIDARQGSLLCDAPPPSRHDLGVQEMSRPSGSFVRGQHNNTTRTSNGKCAVADYPTQRPLGPAASSQRVPVEAPAAAKDDDEPIRPIALTAAAINTDTEEGDEAVNDVSVNAEHYLRLRMNAYVGCGASNAAWFIGLVFVVNLNVFHHSEVERVCVEALVALVAVAGTVVAVYALRRLSTARETTVAPLRTRGTFIRP